MSQIVKTQYGGTIELVPVADALAQWLAAARKAPRVQTGKGRAVQQAAPRRTAQQSRTAVPRTGLIPELSATAASDPPRTSRTGLLPELGRAGKRPR
jgi:hypothetical protein